MLLAGGFIASLVYHKPLRLAGGQGKFCHTWLATTYVSVSFLPFIVLAEGVCLRFFHTRLATSTSTGLEAVYLATLLAKLHEITYRKALGIVAGITVASLVIVFGLLLTFA